MVNNCVEEINHEEETNYAYEKQQEEEEEDCGEGMRIERSGDGNQIRVKLLKPSIDSHAHARHQYLHALPRASTRRRRLVSPYSAVITLKHIHFAAST
ncbi:unnamed protein product [Arabis nemorensis]|uniref:Uncharacterized protein n=1 Tax=Arabis nemorensis TaxID=586526 RepID=A0A565BLX9_9BRAS|nr:unnamed protein product [Arabis nemorensis]